MEYGKKSLIVRKMLNTASKPQTMEISNVSKKVIQIAHEVPCSENLVWRVYINMKEEYSKVQEKVKFLEELIKETKFLYDLLEEFIKGGMRELTSNEFRKYKNINKKLEKIDAKLEVLQELGIEL